jgi:cytochrome bd-type quinol oxidase subunit 2
MTQQTAYLIAGIGGFIALVLGIYFGYTGKTDKWNWYQKFKPFAFWIGIVLIVVSTLLGIFR